MNEVDFKIKTDLIKEKFHDPRQIECETPSHIRQVDEGVHEGGDVFTTTTGEFIDLEFQLEDFDEYELAKYAEFAENLYEKHKKHVSVYLICPKNINVLVRECKIKSEADFTIKLFCSQEDPCRIILDSIKNKIRKNEPLTGEDLHALEMLQVMCSREDRNYYRVEYLKIINNLSY